MVEDDSAASREKPPLPRHLKALGYWMDESISLPGGFRIGWDGIIGLIPGIGDLAGMGVSAYIVVQSARLGVTRSVLVRMMVNTAAETIIGSVPVAGDLFDFAFKANRRNLRLLQSHLENPITTRRRSHARLAVLAIIGLLCMAGVLFLFIRIIAWSRDAIS